MNNPTGLHVLLRRIAQGDTTARSELNDLVWLPLIQYITAHFGSSFSADDIAEIVSQSILIMLLHAASYRGDYGDSSAWRWAQKIVRNQALKWLKTMKREIHFPDSGGDTDVDEARIQKKILQFNPNLDTGTPEEQVADKLFRENVKKILQHLSGRERLILHLYSEKEWTFKQIAEYLSVSPARITQIMQDIRRKCQSAAI